MRLRRIERPEPAPLSPAAGSLPNAFDALRILLQFRAAAIGDAIGALAFLLLGLDQIFVFE